MQVRYLFHSGFLVEGRAGYYLFDYYRGELPPLSPEKPVTVFVSHGHQDHYNPEIFPLLRSKGAREILGVISRDIPERRLPKGESLLRVRAGETLRLPGGEGVETLLSTDQGVAFLVDTPEGLLYHAGDLNDWVWPGEDERENRQMRGMYRHEIDRIKGRPVDLAFVPLDPRQEEEAFSGLAYFLEKVPAKKVFPMHYWQQPEIIEAFINAYPQYNDRIIQTDRFGGKWYAVSNDPSEL